MNLLSEHGARTELSTAMVQSIQLTNKKFTRTDWFELTYKNGTEPKKGS